MARIAGVDLPRNKRIEIALTYIFGIGRSLSNEILEKAGVDPNKKSDELNDDEVVKIRQVIDQSYKVEGDLRRDVAMNIKRYMDLGTYRGLRHRREPAGARSAHAHQCPHPQGTAARHRRQEEGAVEGLMRPEQLRTRRMAKPQATEKPTHQERKKAKRIVSEGVVHIHSTFNNTIVTITDPVGQRRRLVERRRRRLQGLAQGHAVRGAARRRRGGQEGDGQRRAQRPGAREGAGRGPRVGAPVAAERRAFTITVIRTSRRSRTTAAGRPSGGASERRQGGDVARYTDSVCRLCRREGAEALSQGRALLHRQVRHRAAQLSARPARPGAREVLRVRPAAAREAEGEAHVRRARAAVPPLLHDRRARARHHRRDPAAAARAAPRQHGLPHGVRDLARRGAAARAPRPLPGQRPQGQHSVVPAARPGDVVTVRERSQNVTRIQEALAQAERRGVPEWLEVNREGFSARVKALPDPRRADDADQREADRRAVLEVRQRRTPTGGSN